MKLYNAITDGRGQETQSVVDVELLDVRAMATVLGCSQRHVYRMADADMMPRPVRLGALVRWHRAAVLEWINAGCPNCRKAGAR